jgi:hypothetical protein
MKRGRLRRRPRCGRNRPTTAQRGDKGQKICDDVAEIQVFKAGQRGTDDDDRLTERDHDERLDPLRGMGSIDVPFPSRGAAQPRYLEADRRGKAIEGDHERPEHLADVTLRQPTDDGQ